MVTDGCSLSPRERGRVRGKRTGKGRVTGEPGEGATFFFTLPQGEK